MPFTTHNKHSQIPGYLQSVLDAVSAPVIILTPDFKLISANKTASPLLAASFNEKDQTCLCHKILFDFDLPCSAQDLPCPLQDVLATKEEATAVRKIDTAHDKTRWLEIKAQPLFDEAGDIVQIIETISDITHHKEMTTALMRFSRGQEDFFLASQKISTNSDLRKLYRHIVSHAKELLQIDFSTLMLFSEDKRCLVLRDTVGFPETTINTFVVMEGQGLATYVAKTKKPDTVLDFQTETRFEVPQLVTERNIRSAICVPMNIAGEIMGVLVGHTLQQRTFSDQEITLYYNLANQAAMALHSAQTLKDLRESEDRYHDLFENSLDIIQMVDGDGRILYTNKAWKNALGYSDDEISQMSAFDIIHPDSRSHCQVLFGQLCRGEKVDLMVTNFVAKNGRSIPVEGHINANIKDGKLVSTRGIFRDVTDRKVFEDKLHAISITDELTGLLNRRGFFTLAEKQLAISGRTGSNLYLLYADLDNMKLINDQQGHKVGDQALKDTARLLREIFRDGDILARVGGDEFTVLLTTIAEDQNEQSVLTRFDRKLAELNNQKNRSFELLISTGIVKQKGKSPCLLEDLMSRADHLMYENKRQRKQMQQDTSSILPS
ncbi:MAG: diguanylate cyclase [Proteobacteria bacterium]|nr:diguanylate cyclase [Pseudomonadota bacterium]MBU1641198.1 diguanylate cyclase [Pseudomonadota bacterium]